MSIAAALPLLPRTAAAIEPMTFSIATIGGHDGVCGRNCAEVINASGEITNETADNFLAFLSAHLREQALRPVILIESPGGTVVGAMQLGLLFRKIGAAVIVAQAMEDERTSGLRVTSGNCMSACVYAFFGGRKRVVPSVSHLGIHRMVINEAMHDPSGGLMHFRSFGDNDIVSTLAAYTKLMGVDPQVIAAAEQIDPDTIHIVTPREIARWRLGSPHL